MGYFVHFSVFLEFQLNSLGEAVFSDTFWVALGSIGAIITLFLIYYQIRTVRIIAAANFLVKLEKRFSSKEMRKSRKKLVSIIRSKPDSYSQIDETRDVLDFFDDLAILLDKKVIPLELIWSGFCYWILRYQILLKDYIEWMRKEEHDFTLYIDFDSFCEKVRKQEEKERHSRMGDITSKQLEEFVKEEMRLK